MLSVAEARAHILSGVEPLRAEEVSIYVAAGRTLAADLPARLAQPPFDSSAMDGYAVCPGDVLSAPVRLRVTGESAAGHGFSGQVSPGEAVRIFTGAPIPRGAGTVVIQENTETAAPGEVTILEAAKPGQNVRPCGHDFREGEVLLQAGMVLGPRQLMLAAAMNHSALPVRRKPLVAIIANGDELVPPGELPRTDQIVSSIPAGLGAAVIAWGGKAVLSGIAKDTKASIRTLAAAAREADILVTIGGASVGDRDLMKVSLEENGAVFQVMKVSMRPGKPVMFGLTGKQRVLGLPGNPASAFICARLYLKPLIAALLGLETAERAEHLPLASPIEANGGREHYMRSVLSGGTVAPLPDQDSSLVTALSRANCLIVRPAYAPALNAGASVPTLAF
jgi:molybdopterin molybdotransferase